MSPLAATSCLFQSEKLTSYPRRVKDFLSSWTTARHNARLMRRFCGSKAKEGESILRKFTLVVFAAVITCFMPFRIHAGGPGPAAPDWKNARQISPAELAKKIAGPPTTRPIVLQVGFKVLYDGGHIPGAIFAGPASARDGLARLKALAERIPRGKEVVLYCGCCPWEKCPNIHPAYDALRRMGFERLVVLLIPQDFAHDWVAQGLPVARTK